MKLEDLVIEIEAQLPDLLAQEANWLANELKKRTPSNRVQTRSGIYVRVGDQSATVGIRFAKYYGGNTPTRQWLREQWRQLRPLVRQRIIQKLNDFLQGS